ncbi:NAD(P)/FAD-dependent oxidoreductase [Thioclava sp. 15-R06ZXC-3]|uniref:NAD(P)/FAD-dependent oxidoreductase n=1 Tax=Thioclava arctica TaxID=3238301 RepID=A0ABV3TQA2_9RHOB
MTYDFVIIGAGISGAAAAFELSGLGSVALVEAESAPGYHATGRSAALFTPLYGAPTVRQISAASYAFLSAPPDGFCHTPLLTPRGQLTVAGPLQEAGLADLLALSCATNPVTELTASETLELLPFLRPERVVAGAIEAGVTDIDVASLLASYLRAFKARGGTLMTGQPVTGLTRGRAGWIITTSKSVISGRTVINAAGAWAGQIGALAGAVDIGLIPMRRTAIVVEPPAGLNVAALPAADFIGTNAYLKPEAGKLMASPGDRTPSEPQDARPEELDIAILADWLETETLIKVRRINHSWAGLRSFVSDDVPVVGFDPVAPDFFWLAGQGGFGIMMAPALGRAVVSLIAKSDLPDDISARGIAKDDLSPNRLVAPRS